MKAATTASLAIVTVGLIVNIASPAQAAYVVGQATDVAPAEAAAPAADLNLNLSTGALVHSSAEPGAAEPMRMAGNYTRKRRLRIKSPTRIKKHRRLRKPSSMAADNTTRTHAEAPLDCSIESHPDCPSKPKPKPGGSHHSHGGWSDLLSFSQSIHKPGP